MREHLKMILIILIAWVVLSVILIGFIYLIEALDPSVPQHTQAPTPKGRSILFITKGSG